MSTIAVVVMTVAVIFLCVQIYEQSCYVRWPILNGDVIGFGVGPRTVDWDDSGRVDYGGKNFFIVRVQMGQITREYRFYQFVEGLRLGDKVGVHVHPVFPSIFYEIDFSTIGLRGHTVGGILILSLLVTGLLMVFGFYLLQFL